MFNPAAAGFGAMNKNQTIPEGLNVNNIRQLPARQAGGPDEKVSATKQNSGGV